MKKIQLVLLLIFIGTILFAVETFNERVFYPNIIVVCFDANAIKTNTGDIFITKTEDGQVQIGLESFDKYAINYNFIDIKRMYFVDSQDWHDTNGAYPMNIFRVTLKDNEVIEQALSVLETDKDIIFAEYEAIMYAAMPEKYIPNDPLFSASWHLTKIQAPELWRWAAGDSTVIVGIVDSGVKWNHEDLRENIFVDWEQAINTTINWETGVITPHSTVKFEHSIIAWSYAIGQDNNQSYQSFQNNQGNNNHGTHVAGIVSSVGDNGLGTLGTAMGVKLLVPRHSPNNAYSTVIENAYDGIYYAANHGAHVINCSWGGGGGAGVANTAVNYATFEKGALVVVASGNDAPDYNGPSVGVPSIQNWPANCENAMTVGATDSNDRRAYFSEYGPGIDVMAPGMAIMSTSFNYSQDNYVNLQGTSMASPVAAAVAAMVKTIHPEMGPLEIKDKIMETCDMPDSWWDDDGYWLDMLGAGRVNAFRAAMNSVIPNIYIEEVQINELSGDGDGVPNVGETISVKLMLHNEWNWLNATGITASISSTYPGVEVLQGNLEYNSINNGQYIYSTNYASVYVSSSVNTLNIPFTLTFSSNQEATNPYPYTVNIPFVVEISNMLPNWPLILNGQAVSAPKVANLDGTGNRFISVFNGILHVVDANKTPNQGFPLNLGENTQSGIAVGHLTGAANSQQIVVATSSGILKVIDHTGQIVMEKNLLNQVRTAPVIADLNNNGQNEIIVATIVGTNTRLWVLNGNDLSEWDGYPVQIQGQVTTHIAADDVNGDGIKNIVFNTSGPTAGLNVFNPITTQNIAGFPFSGASYVGPTLARLSGNTGLQIIFAGSVASNCPLYIINPDGSVFGQTTIPQRVNTEIAIVDLFNNGSPKLVFADNGGNLHVRNTDLTNVDGFPVNVGTAIESSPVFANIDTDPPREIIFGDNNGNLHILKSNGQYLAGFPIKVSQSAIRTAPWVGQMHNNNCIIMLVNNEGVLAIDTKRYTNDSFWNSFRANNGNTASYNDPFTPDTDLVDPIYTNNLKQNYPNPFNPVTTIEFSLKNAEYAQLSVYNIKGQLVKTLANERFDAGSHSIIWNGTDSNNIPISSGLYFYKLETESYSSIKRMIMLK